MASRQRFWSSAGGRVFLAILGVALAGPGVLALLGPGPYTTPILSVVMLLCMAGSIFAVGLSSADDFHREAIGMIIFLPLVGGFYLAGLHLAADLGVVAGVLLVLLGLVSLFFALAGGRFSSTRASAARSATETSTSPASHAA